MTVSSAYDIPREDQEAVLERVRFFARVMDSYIHLPGGYTLGVEGIIGLVPGIGDAVGSLFALYIPYEAYRLNAPDHIILKMLGNVAIDALFGAVPVLGDLFDIAWKANLRNVALLEEWLEVA